MKKIFALILLHFTILYAAPYQSVRDVPSPKNSHSDDWVSDPDNYIEAEWESKINVLLDSHEQSTSNEIAVVILNSIGSAVPKNFAVELFNTWGIGKAGKDNGLLLLIVMDQRRWEFETGYGLEGTLPDAFLKRAGEDSLLPYFKKGKFGEGIYRVLETVTARAEGKTGSESIANSDDYGQPSFTDEYPTRSGWEKAWYSVFTVNPFIVFALLIITFVYFATLTPGKNKKKIQQKENKKRGNLYWFQIYLFPSLLWFGAFTGWWFTAILWGYIAYAVTIFTGNILNIRKTFRENPDPYNQYKGLRRSYGWKFFLQFLLFPYWAIPVGLYLLSQIKGLRKKPRICPQCSTTMNLLDEKADDFFLKEGQRIEEQIGSIDYDVWHCSSCEHVTIEAYDAWFTRYNKCPSCNYRTYYLSSSVTLVSPTCSSSGSGERTYSCKYCDHTHSETYTIPARDCSSSSSSGGGFSGGSSGGSFGGGSSGGGGSGGSW